MIEFKSSTHGRFWYFTKEQLNEKLTQKHGNLVQKMAHLMDFTKQIAERYKGTTNQEKATSVLNAILSRPEHQ